MENKIHIKHLDLGYGFIIENDEVKSLIKEDVSVDDSTSLEETAAELIDMARKIDDFYKNNENQEIGINENGK